MRARLPTLVLLALLCLDGCAPFAGRQAPPLPIAELLLVGFPGTQVDGNDEVRRDPRRQQRAKRGVH